MKRIMLFSIAFMLMLGLIACAMAPVETVPETTILQPTTPNVTDPTVPDNTDPKEEIELVYDIANYQSFLYVFLEKPVEEWNSMGRYTLRLEGLHTPVVVSMDGTSVLSVSAFDQTVDLGSDGMANDYHDGYSPVQSIRSTQDAVVTHVSFGESGDGSILITNGHSFQYPEENGGEIFLFVKDNGALGYCQTWTDPGDIEEQGLDVLHHLTSRDQVLYTTGRAEIAEGELVLTAEETVLLSDHFDLDAMFAEGKTAGMFTEYEALDELFEANKARL